jgi:hypothetical protein
VLETAILRYGFVEGEAEVHGDWVTYDPQSPKQPAQFEGNGSTATHLAVVGNEGEVAALAGVHSTPAGPYPSVVDMGRTIIGGSSAEVVVVKQGSLGATVISDADDSIIPAYRTEQVWSIGSGDIFSSTFAYYWSILHRSPHESAQLASMATALYCSNRLLASTARLANFELTEVKRERGDASKQKPRVYLAGPFFTMSQRWLIEEARKALSLQGLQVFSPYHDIGLGDANYVVQKRLRGDSE